VSRTTSVVRLIAVREMRERLRKSYALFTGLLVLAILAIGVITRLAGGDDTESVTIGVAGPAPAGFAELATQIGEPLDREVTVTDIEAGDTRQALDDGDIDAAVVAGDRRIVHADDVDAETEAIVQQAWATAELQAGLAEAEAGPGQVEDIVSPDPLTATTLEGDDEDEGLALVTGTLTAILLFISLQVFGNYALMGVVEEKSSAVVELLLVRVRADQLLAGKLLGLAVVALLQVVAAIVAGMVALAISGTGVPGDIWSALPLALVWFVGGFALFGTLYALAGSLVSRQEDAQAAAGPIVTVLILAYMTVYVFGYMPESVASRVLSVTPPIAPFLMPMRMTAGAASVAEITIAIVLLVATTVAVWKLAGRIYEQVLLRKGSRIPWREAVALVSRG
jgi:ABC-2 type transport system permease protein